jgi:hypothetical protein
MTALLFRIDLGVYSQGPPKAVVMSPGRENFSASLGKW